VNTWQRVLISGLKQGRGALNPQQLKVFQHLCDCRQLEAGSETYACETCGYEETIARSCRDRHCPGCQYRATLRWCEARRADVIPVNYFHLVFTLPSQLNSWVSCYGSVIYRLLFESVWSTLSTFGRAPKRLDGQLGMLAVLHTWGQTLVRHVHLHCLIPGGALTNEGRWNAARSNYLFPVKALSRQYRGRMVSGLREASNQGLLSRIPDDEIDTTLNSLMQTEWVVYSKAVSYGHDRLIDYLGRYTRKIAISQSRIRHFDGEQVSLDYRDYRDGQKKQMCLSALELVRRFALHILPKGFMRVRYYGFLANAVRRQKLNQIRAALQVPAPVAVVAENRVVPVCPRCGGEHWHFVGAIVRWHWQPG
jgi:hypothetical protein